MKRSEAVKIIKKSIMGIDFEDSFPDEVEEHADYILCKLEKIGMLPPEIPVPNSHPESEFYSAWEPEDEK